MKRYAIFLGIGPLIGYVFAVGEMFLFFQPPDFSWLLPGAIFAYVVGLLPAGTAALADAKWKRIVITTMVGGLASAMWPVVQYLLSGYGIEGMAGYAVIGMIAAAVCSWLTARTISTERPRAEDEGIDR